MPSSYKTFCEKFPHSRRNKEEILLAWSTVEEKTILPSEVTANLSLMALPVSSPLPQKKTHKPNYLILLRQGIKIPLSLTVFFFTFSHTHNTHFESCSINSKCGKERERQGSLGP